MKKQLPRKEFELQLLDIRCKVLREKLPNLSERKRDLMAKKWVKAKMRELDGDVIEFTVPDPKPLNRWQAFKDKYFPVWLKRFSPVEYHPA
jgi:hypothetical protein